ncbi:sugar O-acetyltransferase [Lacticaseibacillus brantae]|uniref:Acetyltransferase n=1 Tax=Lacticaseibacillus brantae DSM 23927 TaxID=1423727 RepID=A0A0R2B6V2_9LACO|nr:sugar O-acetyltransferase [Lacticaseibacillus brantae]KRM72171.1 galactoside O-acetyltransferase [Lacticaseibacillus brantae DSM 23927]
MTERDNMLAGKLYIADDEELRRVSHKGKRLARLLSQTTEEDGEIRFAIMKQLFKSVGEGSYIEPPFHTDYGAHTTIGKNFYANYDAIFIDTAPITIGDNVMFGPRAGLYTAGHPIDAAIRNEQLEYGYPIVIGNNVWLGGNVVVNPGVTIGSNVVIGSGSVVTKDIPDNVVAVGNPAHVLRPITEADKTYWQQQKQHDR